jgi:hypothetical protein
VLFVVQIARLLLEQTPSKPQLEASADGNDTVFSSFSRWMNAAAGASFAPAVVTGAVATQQQKRNTMALLSVMPAGAKAVAQSGIAAVLQSAR